MDCLPGSDDAGRPRDGATGRSRSARRDRCAACGAVVALTGRHFVAAPPETDRVYPFCSAPCRSAWLAARQRRAGTGRP